MSKIRDAKWHKKHHARLRKHKDNRVKRLAKFKEGPVTSMEQAEKAYQEAREREFTRETPTFLNRLFSK